MTNYHAWDSKVTRGIAVPTVLADIDRQMNFAAKWTSRINETKKPTMRLLDLEMVRKVELYKCSRLELSLDQPLGTLQVDECEEPVAVKYAERDHVGKAYHQNSPGFSMSWGLCGPASSTVVGQAGSFQLLTCLVDTDLRTEPVRRGEGEFPLDARRASPASDQPEPEAAPASEQRRQEAEKHRLAGNDMFRASDFSQAAALYSLALQLAPDMGAVWANRAQCWLKMGDHEKAFADAEKCTEVEPMNPKGWFRKGISLHAMQRYAEAIPALLEAEKLEPSNKQILDAIKMAQLMARKSA
ncbi:HOP1, partial [Symbiodinium sp. CCMP2456]